MKPHPIPPTTFSPISDIERCWITTGIGFDIAKIELRRLEPRAGDYTPPPSPDFDAETNRTFGSVRVEGEESR